MKNVTAAGRSGRFSEMHGSLPHYTTLLYRLSALLQTAQTRRNVDASRHDGLGWFG